MCSPSALIRVNYLVMRFLHFRNTRGDLQEGHFTLPDATCLSFRAQNRHFCALLPFGTLIFGLFEHKIGVFVSKWAIFPRFWVVLTQNRHFCARGWLPRVQQCPLKPSRAHRSSAPPATCPAGCILQQCARQIDCRNPLPRAPTTTGAHTAA